ncbi:phosphonate ABC transporter, permease protein PhnE [Sandarakinorhabdus sp. AAP62]|uniref:phosphonate ABC transporter, permease protein PhnE n=1 Tax=Sandarakinorhabdus sp. AAP62 TaxID=1248916 RepID=UPI0002D9C6D2|nr:phosphonate ABC transporter, permease protein PhnE [Sandarakinorhabdus sp. AAP62]
MAADADTALIARFEATRRAVLLRQRAGNALVLIGLSALLGVSFHLSDFFNGNHGGDPLTRIADLINLLVPTLKADVLMDGPRTAGSLASWYYDGPRWLALLWETVQIAIVSTVLGAIGGSLAALLASKNLSPVPALHWLTRRSLEIVRTLPDLIVALILVAAFGIGPLPGVIAIALGSSASLGKLFSEANENIDPRPLEAIKASGGGWWAQMRFGLLPQVLPTYASYALLRLEINVGAAAALGVVGAGGIGIELSRAITYTQFDTYLAILLMIVVLIFAIDMISERLRHRLIGLERPA